MYALADGAQFIWDFDDDNILFPNETLASYTSALEHTTFTQVHTQKNTECECSILTLSFDRPSWVSGPEAILWITSIAPECQLLQQYCSYY
jgi:hypothetical protein